MDHWPTYPVAGIRITWQVPSLESSFAKSISMESGHDVLGLASETVVVRPYTPEWPQLYLAEEARLVGCIGEYVLDIQHIGSTSIPGMIAKPILDVAIAVYDFEEATRCIQPIERLGYHYRGEYGISRRHYFTKGNPRTHHLHMLERHSENWANTISFRDHLRQNPSLAEEYAALKQRLSEQFPTDRLAYQDGKAAFIHHVLHAANEKVIGQTNG